MHDIRFTLAIQVLERLAPNQHGTFCNVAVTAWENGESVSTVSIVEMKDMVLPESAEINTAEQWAAVVTRVVARLVDQNLYDQLAVGELHTREHFMIKVSGESPS